MCAPLQNHPGGVRHSRSPVFRNNHRPDFAQYGIRILHCALYNPIIELVSYPRIPAMTHSVSNISTREPNSRSNSKPSVAILLATYNGAAFLPAQLNSYEAQCHDNWRVWASDDGSTDETLPILASYQQRWSERLSVISGPGRGFVVNFLSLIHHPEILADHYAYSDQDDVWDSDKLSKAVSWLSTIAPTVPALYCSRTRLVDEQEHPLGFSPLMQRPPSFAHALVQNIAGGNTMVFNQAARALLQGVGPDVEVVTFDWWTYLLVTGSGGQVFYDSQPSLSYRQHGQNLVGADEGWPERWSRLVHVWKGYHTQWNDQNIRALRHLDNRLTAENLQTLRTFAWARQQSLGKRLWGLKRSGVYRQPTLKHWALFWAAFFDRI